MGLIKEPLNVDFYFDGREMTDEDQKRVSDFISKKTANKKNRQLLAVPVTDNALDKYLANPAVLKKMERGRKMMGIK